MIVHSALLCLALNVYHEARSEPLRGQYAVALVTQNRAEHDDSKVCGEVFKPFQFSWANGQVTHLRNGGWKIPAALQPREKDAWWKALKIASLTLAGHIPDFTKGSTFYHTRAVHPAWRKAYEVTVRVGAHIFYRVPGHQSELTAGL